MTCWIFSTRIFFRPLWIPPDMGNLLILVDTRQASDSSVTHFRQASEASARVVESVDSVDIVTNIANSKYVACRAFHFNSASNLSVPIAINGVSMTAILDTGAQVTVVSDACVRGHLAGLKLSGHII